MTAETEMSSAVSGKKHETHRELKSHTEASIAILLYDELLKGENYLIQPQDAMTLLEAVPGTLVEVAGILEKNAVDAVIDIIDAVKILSSLQNLSQIIEDTELENLRTVLDKDRQRTPLSNIILRCDKPPGINVLVTLRTANLRDLTLTELHMNNVRVIGKITRVVREGESISPFENYGLSLLNAETLENLFKEIASSGGLVANFSEVVIKGPVVQILPLMVFV